MSVTVARAHRDVSEQSAAPTGAHTEPCAILDVVGPLNGQEATQL